MNEPTGGIKQELEALQVWSYGQIGRDPAEIPEHIDLSRYRQRQTYLPDVPAHKVHEWIRASSEIADPQYRAAMDEVYAQFRTTAYQDPVILGGIAHSIEQIAQAARMLFPDRAAALVPPVIATVPIALLNGFAMQDRAGHSGIVLQEGLRFAPLHMASEIGRHLFVEHPECIGVDFDPKSLVARLAASTDWADKLIGIFVRDASEPHMLAPTEERLVEIQTSDARHAYAAIDAGFKTFVLAHEYAHCLNRHIDQLLMGTNGPRLMRDMELMKEAIELARQKYPQHPAASDEQRRAFAMLHALEFDADRVALELLIQALRNKVADEGTRLMWIVGALALFWYVELTERVHRTFRLGDVWFDDELYTKDFHVQSLLLRPTHPAPIERAISLLTMVSHEYREGWIQSAVFGGWRWLDALFETAWATTRPLVAAAVDKQGLRIDRKWVDGIPLHLIAIGVKSL
jgi:hypothetical protein